MDSFDKKRQMVKVLLDTLKQSAGDEMGRDMAPKQVTLTPKPEMNVADRPHMKESFDKGHEMADGGMVDLTKEQHLMEPTSEDRHMSDGGYADGGMPLESDEPEREIMPKEEDRGGNDALELLPEAPKDEQGNEERQQEEHNEYIEECDEDNNQSAFDGLFPRRKKK